MKTFVTMAACAVMLAGCGGTTASTGSLNNSGFLSDGTDTSFLMQGTTSCPGIAGSGNPIYERYPLRCGPQAQVVPQ